MSFVHAVLHTAADQGLDCRLHLRSELVQCMVCSDSHRGDCGCHGPYSAGGLRTAIADLEQQHKEAFSELAKAMDQDTTLNTTTASTDPDTSTVHERVAPTPMVVLFNTVSWCWLSLAAVSTALC
jgi:hypothetical protein